MAVNKNAASVLYGGKQKYQEPSWQRTGFAKWIDYDSANNVIKYGNYTFNPAEAFGLQVVDKGSWEEKLKRDQEAMKAKYGASYQWVSTLLNGPERKGIGATSAPMSIQDMMQKNQWEKNRKTFTWKDPTGKVYTETGSGDTLLPMSKAFAQMVADATWANRGNAQTSRWGKSPDGAGKSPYDKQTNNGMGKAPTKGLLV